MLLVLLPLLAHTLAAHAPHDEVKLVKLSPAFVSDGTAFFQGRLTDRLVLGKTTDGGRSWTILRAPIVGHDLRDLAFSPDWTADQTLFAATGDAGVWRSVDGGLSWSPSSLGLLDPEVADLAVSPAFATDRTLLAATPVGLYRSKDAGQSWTRLESGLGETSLTAVAFAPSAPGVVFAGRLSLQRSNDGGDSFVALQHLPAPLNAIGVSPAFATDASLALCFSRFGQGVQRSTDGGASLQSLTDGLLDLRVNDVELAGDGTLFCATYAGGCQRLLPGATQWEQLDQGWEELSDLTDNHSVDVAISPGFATDGVVLVASFEGLFRTDQAGDPWTQADVYSQRVCKQVVFSPGYRDDGLVFVGDYGGGPFVHRRAGGVLSAGPPVSGTGSGVSSHADSGAGADGLPGAPAPEPLPQGPGWTHLGTEVASLWSSVLTLSPAFVSDRTLYSAYNGLYRSRDAGVHWEIVPTPVGVPRVLTLVPTYPAEPTLFLGSSDQGSFRSDDDGASWQPVAGGLPGNVLSTAIAVSPGWPADPRLYWATQSSGIWRSGDGGITFELITAPDYGHKLRGLALSPDFVSDNVILSATNGFGVLRSDDGGDTWVAVNTGLPSGDDNVIESLAFSPFFGHDGTVFLASMYDGVFRSVDGGLSWEPAGIGLPVAAPRALAVSPDYRVDQTLWLSTFDWVWRSTDGGDSWSRLPGDLRVNDHHPSAGGGVQGGDWIPQNQPGNYALSVLGSNLAGANLRFSFQGDRIIWFAQRDAESGWVDVYLDGELLDRYDLYSPVTMPQQAIFTRLFPAVDWHDVRLVVVGQSDPASEGTWVKTDGFRQRF